MRKLRKVVNVLVITGLAGAMAVGCGGGNDTEEWDASKEISVVSREDGSGTRGAFIELTGVEEKNADGNKVDNTTVGAIITNNTEVMLSTVSGDKYAIGYVSLGSMKDTVKALKVEGVEASAENIKNGTYKVSRSFNIVTSGKFSEITQDFIDFILSFEGQKIVEDNGYVAVDSEATAFASNGAEGKVVVSGSSSVTPVMEKLKEAYEELNTKAEIEVQQSDSSTGIESAIKGTCDIGMSSREIKDTELEEGLTPTVIARDGIAIIVNKNSKIDNITLDQIKSIYIGETTEWSDVSSF